MTFFSSKSVSWVKFVLTIAIFGAVGLAAQKTQADREVGLASAVQPPPECVEKTLGAPAETQGEGQSSSQERGNTER